MAHQEEETTLNIWRTLDLVTRCRLILIQREVLRLNTEDYQWAHLTVMAALQETQRWLK